MHPTQPVQGNLRPPLKSPHLVHAISAGLLYCVLASPMARAENFVVSTILDAGTGSLRQAIQDANASGLFPHEILFNIPGAGPHTIQPETEYPDLVRSTLIDGFSQPGSRTNTLDMGLDSKLEIVLDGGLLIANGLVLEMLKFDAPDSGVHGLVIQNLAVEGSAAITLAGVRGSVQGCFLGTNATGTGAQGNTLAVLLLGDSQLIGGPLPEHRNLISGNGSAISMFSSNNVIINNTIGPDRSGIVPLRGGSGIVSRSTGTQVSNNNIIGLPGLGNVISGLGFGDAIALLSSNGAITQGTVVQGNRIGLDRSGTIPVPNNGQAGGISATTGIRISASRTVIGGTQPGQGNIIGNNSLLGISINADFVGVVGNRIGVDLNGDPAPNQGAAVSIQGSFNTIGGIVPGFANIIAHASGPNGYGVTIGPGLVDPEGHGNSIRGNSIHSNEAGGIDLLSGFMNEPGFSEGPTANDPLDVDRGTNGLQNYPTITDYSPVPGGTRVIGFLNSQPNTPYRLEFFANQRCSTSGYGQGETLLTSLTQQTDGTGTLAFDLVVPLSGPVVTATATDPNGSTSEFSLCATLPQTLAVPLSSAAQAALAILLAALGWITVQRSRT